jgi:hypothetical protein
LLLAVVVEQQITLVVQAVRVVAVMVVVVQHRREAPIQAVAAEAGGYTQAVLVEQAAVAL